MHSKEVLKLTALQRYQIVQQSGHGIFQRALRSSYITGLEEIIELCKVLGKLFSKNKQTLKNGNKLAEVRSLSGCGAAKTCAQRAYRENRMKRRLMLRFGESLCSTPVWRRMALYSLSLLGPPCFAKHHSCSTPFTSVRPFYSVLSIYPLQNSSEIHPVKDEHGCHEHLST